MKKRTAFLLCGTAAVLTINAVAQATPVETNPSAVPAARSYADLLAPIPNALASLRAEDVEQRW